MDRDNSSHYRAMRALVVDDSKAILQAMAAQLGDLGVGQCDLANTGQEALGLLLTQPDLHQVLFIDLNMPGMDGMQLLNHLSTIRFRGGIVIFSELDERTMQLAADLSTRKRLHMIGCLSKPAGQAQLLGLLQKVKSLRPDCLIPPLELTEEEVRNAIDCRQFIPYFQPKVANDSGQVKALEVLARVLQPGKTNAIEANQFIPCCERNGQIKDVTLHMLDTLLPQYPELRACFGDQLCLALNLSPQILMIPDLPEILDRYLGRHQVPRSALLLEITERSPIDQAVQLETLGRLRIKGFQLSLDDFGTGFTNIRQLKQLPFSEVKLDRSLIHHISDERLSQVIVQSLYDICREMGVHLVAEGIERPEDLDYLNTLPIPIDLQGFVISKPKPLQDICRWHRSWRKTLGLAAI